MGKGVGNRFGEKKKKKEESESKRKKVKGVKVSDKGKDTPLEAEEKSRRQTVLNKRWDKFKEKMVRVTEEVEKWVRTESWFR